MHGEKWAQSYTQFERLHKISEGLKGPILRHLHNIAQESYHARV